MSHLLSPSLREALAAGGVRVELGQIEGRSGYLDPHSRSIVLNPDATDDELNAELGHDLAALAAHDRAQPCRDGPALALVHSVDEPEQPSPRQPRGPSRFRVFG